LKRVLELQPLSHDHHHGLLLCWKIRTGLSRNIAPERIKKYADWFFKSHLVPHFELEEKYVFTVLEEENELRRQALNEHEHLRALFGQTLDLENTVKNIEKELEAHIRFEERVLFSEVQKAATKEQLAKIQEIHLTESFAENEEDLFWK